MIHFRWHMEWFLSVENSTRIHVCIVLDPYALHPWLNKNTTPAGKSRVDGWPSYVSSSWRSKNWTAASCTAGTTGGTTVQALFVSSRRNSPPLYSHGRRAAFRLLIGAEKIGLHLNKKDTNNNYFEIQPTVHHFLLLFLRSSTILSQNNINNNNLSAKKRGRKGRWFKIQVVELEHTHPAYYIMNHFCWIQSSGCCQHIFVVWQEQPWVWSSLSNHHHDHHQKIILPLTNNKS